VACSEVMKEVLFILQLLEHLQVKIQLLICAHVNNIGAIFLAENQNSSDRTKNVDTRYHFVRQAASMPEDLLMDSHKETT